MCSAAAAATASAAAASAFIHSTLRLSPQRMQISMHTYYGQTAIYSKRYKDDMMR